MVYPRPKSLTPQGEALYLLLVYVQDIFCKKDLCNSPCLYAEDYTNRQYRTFFEIDSSGKLASRILLEYYFSEVAVSSFQNLQSNRKVTNYFPVGSHRNTYLPTCSVVAPS